MSGENLLETRNREKTESVWAEEKEGRRRREGRREEEMRNNETRVENRKLTSERASERTNRRSSSEKLVKLQRRYAIRSGISWDLGEWSREGEETQLTFFSSATNSLLIRSLQGLQQPDQGSLIIMMSHALYSRRLLSILSSRWVISSDAVLQRLSSSQVGRWYSSLSKGNKSWKRRWESSPLWRIRRTRMTA